MFKRDYVRNAAALITTVFFFVSTMPIVAAPTPASLALGSITGGRTLQVRGVPVIQEGTVFTGDEINTDDASHAELILVGGSKVELFGNTRCVVGGSREDTQISLAAGNVGFAATRGSVAIVVGRYEVIPQPGATGGVAFLAGNFAGIRMATGSAMLRDLRTNSSARVTAGNTRIVDVKTGDMNVSIAELASTAAVPLPSGAPIPPQTSRPHGLSSTQWAILIASIGAAGGTAIILATRDSCKSAASPAKPC